MRPTKTPEDQIAPKQEPPFSSLSPVKDVSSYVNYQGAFDFIVSNPVKNIALTGPYGSGKSSLILTFRESHPKKHFLNLSLANFETVDGENPDEQEIERSIFKQMLYGENANDLPYSRFKGIMTPESPWWKSLYIAVLALGTYSIFSFKGELYNLAQQSWICLGVVLFLVILWFVFIVCFVRWVYVNSFGLSLKKVSLKNAEIETSGEDKESIFNEHLDEIIYFFQSTDYDFVVVEDLDRFENPNIFVSLRELNCLINENAGVKKKRGGDPIKFLYALRDDMFCDKDRTKFFDFIIPVIPLINNSNSYDKLCESLEKVNLLDCLDANFLRNVALHINDFRHLNNTINEFRIYLSNLGKENLDKTQLFAIVLYKNFYPNDFELLHNNKGTLYSIVTRRSEKITQASSQLKRQIEEVNASIQTSEELLAKDVESLVYMYKGYLASEIVCIPNTIQDVRGYNSITPLNSIENFLQLDESSSFRGVSANNRQVNSNLKLSDIEEALHPGQTIQEKVNELERCNKGNITNLQEELSTTQHKLREVNQKKLMELFSHSELEEEFGADDKESFRLLFYLIQNGYIDEHYSTYTTYFHEGSLTHKDHEFLLLCQSDKEIEATYEINNPEEVCERVGDVFFEKNQSWNVSIYDYLLGEQHRHKGRIKKTLSLIMRGFDKGDAFLIEYYTTGKHVDVLMQLLCSQWMGFASRAVKSNYAKQHISTIAAYVDDDEVIKQQNVDDVLAEYLAGKSHEVFAQEVCSNRFSILSVLNVKIISLRDSEKLNDLVDYVIENKLYEINIDNVTQPSHRNGKLLKWLAADPT